MTATHVWDRPMKLYGYAFRPKPGTEQKVQYRVGPFANLREWYGFLNTKPGRTLERRLHALVDELTDPPTLMQRGWCLPRELFLPYPFLIVRLSNDLIAGDGTLIFRGER